MATFTEYTTVTDLRSQYLGIAEVKDDALFLNRIRAACQMIDSASLRSFAPRIETRVYDVPHSGNPYLGSYAYQQYTSQWLSGVGTAEDLVLDDDLLSLVTLTNGDGSVIASSNYALFPANEIPKNGIGLRQNANGVVWLSNSGDYCQAIQVSGVWGHTGDKHQSYASTWVDTGNTVNGAHTAATTSLAYSGSGTMKAGSLYLIGSEFVYHVSGASTPLTITRGVNGSTAQTFAGGETISVWTPSALIQELAILGGWMLYKLRDNPTTETLVLPGGQSVVTPKDVGKYIKSKLQDFGLIRTGFA